MTVLLYWLFYSATFAIAQIRVQGTFPLTTDELAQIVRHQLTGTKWGIVPMRNIFAFDAEQFGNRIADAFALGTIYVKKDRPRAIIVAIDEKTREAVWSVRGQYFALDNQGMILGALTADATDDRVVIFDAQADMPPADRAQVILPQALAFLVRAMQNSAIKGLRPQFYIADSPRATEFKLKMGEGWNIYFDTAQPLEPQLRNLELILANSIHPDKRKDLDYIDLRFGEKVYYKYK